MGPQYVDFSGDLLWPLGGRGGVSTRHIGLHFHCSGFRVKGLTFEYVELKQVRAEMHCLA